MKSGPSNVNRLLFVFASICEAFYLSVFVFANKWDMQLFVVTVGAKFYLLQALVKG